MKKFNCKVTKEYEYEIEFDEKVWDEEGIKSWSESFAEVDDLQDLAENLAKLKTEYDEGSFIEGYGIPMINGKEPLFVYGEESKKSINRSVNINIIEENDTYVDVEEIE